MSSVSDSFSPACISQDNRLRYVASISGKQKSLTLLGNLKALGLLDLRQIPSIL
jgi:hypothetical protein